MRIVTVAALMAAFAAPAFAQAPAAPAAGGVFQVIRPGDSAMTCAELSAEANMLNATLMQQQQTQAAAQQQAAAAEAKKAQGRAMLSRFGGAALSIGAQAGMMNGAMSSPLGRGLFSAANQMAASAGQAGAAPANAAPMGAPAPMMSPEQQRMNMLLASYQSKAC